VYHEQQQPGRIPVKETKMTARSINTPRMTGFMGLFAATLCATAVLAQDAATSASVDAVSSATPHAQHDCARHHAHRDGQTPENMMQQFFDELGLTGQQQADIQIITSDYAERFKDLAKLGRATAEELMNLAPDDPSYRDQTDEASALAATSAAEMVVLMAEMRAKLYAVLTIDQRAKLQEKIEQKKRELEEKKLQRQQDTESHDRPFEQFIG